MTTDQIKTSHSKILANKRDDSHIKHSNEDELPHQLHETSPNVEVLESLTTNIESFRTLGSEKSTSSSRTEHRQDSATSVTSLECLDHHDKTTDQLTQSKEYSESVTFEAQIDVSADHRESLNFISTMVLSKKEHETNKLKLKECKDLDNEKCYAYEEYHNFFGTYSSMFETEVLSTNHLSTPTTTWGPKDSGWITVLNSKYEIIGSFNTVQFEYVTNIMTSEQKIQLSIQFAKKNKLKTENEYDHHQPYHDTLVRQNGLVDYALVIKNQIHVFANSKIVMVLKKLLKGNYAIMSSNADNMLLYLCREPYIGIDPIDEFSQGTL
jgi:hypothetical protein